MGKTKIVKAVASMTSHGILGEDASLNRRIVDAMVGAVARCQAEGITDNDAIRLAQLEARDKVLAA